MEIVVCKKYRLIEQSKGKFVNNEHRKLQRSSVKISKEDFEKFNSTYAISGILYEIDEKATEERNKPKELSRFELKKQAESMGLEYSKNIKTEALQALIEENK
jgi:hypothetical protein